MNTIRPKQQAVVESWDDDEDLQGFEGLQLRQASTNTAFSTRSGRHRESLSSRLSGQSREEEGDWQLPIEEDPANTVRNARNAGVPLPANVPASALLGGRITKLGTKKKPSKENYDDDIDFTINTGEGLKLSVGSRAEYPTTLRSVSSNLSPGQGSSRSLAQHSTHSKPNGKLSFQEHLDAMDHSPRNDALDRFRDNEDADDDDVFADASVPTIKIGKTRSPLKVAGFYALPQDAESDNVEDMMEGIDFGSSSSPLRLSKRKVSPAAPANLSPADLDLEGFEDVAGSFNPPIRGSRPSGRSDRSSSITAHSPSVFSPALSSSFTAESEDDGLEGLVLPDGPVNFGEALKRRLESVSPEQLPAKRTEMEAPPKDDFFDELEIEDGKIFDTGRMPFNRNVKYTAAKSSSPSRRGGTTITFTDKLAAGNTRIPKPSTIERPRSKMETISENAPTPQAKRTALRMPTHSAHNSVTSLPTPTTPTFIPPSVPATPTRRGLGTRSSTQSIRPEPTTTSAQLLKAKRSMPHLRQGPPSRPNSMYARPPSRTDQTSKPGATRPKTPVERLGGARTPAPPFLPAGASQAQSHHVSSFKPTRNGRPTSSDSNDQPGPSNRPLSRLSNSQYRPRTPNSRNDVASEALARQAAAKKTLNRPLRRRQYGDGSELDGFDDLVTAPEHKAARQPREAQSTYTLRPTRNSGDLRKHFSAQNLSKTAAANAEQLTAARSLASPARPESKVPSFARDTAASRLAREQRINRQPSQSKGHTQHNQSEGNLHAKYKDQLTVKTIVPPAASPRTLRRTRKQTQPLQLIRNIGGEVKPQKGMHYNPLTGRWEGNENALAVFDGVPDRKKTATPTAASSSSPSRRANTTPRPALIAPVGNSKVVQTSGNMVFDNVQMKWLKVKTGQRSRHEAGSSVTSGSLTSGHQPQQARSVTTATEDEEDDPFAGIPDIEDEGKVEIGAGARKKKQRDSMDSNGSSDESEDEQQRSIIEHFDVGPEFVRIEKKALARAQRKLKTWPDGHFQPLSLEASVEESSRLMGLLFLAA